MTFEEWRTLVKIAYQGGEPTADSLLIAVKDGARAVTVRDVESDLALAKSYRDSFRDARYEMAATRITDPVGTVVAAVKLLMPIDDDTVAITAMLENAIKSAYDIFNGTADRWDALLVEAAIEMQRHVPFFQVRQITTFLADGDGVTNDGFVSRVPVPEDARIQQLWYGHYYPALEADVEYTADDIVVSNGRSYKVITGGTLTIYDLVGGLTSTDGEEEDLGDLVFRYYRPESDWPVRNINWNKRNVLFAGDFSGGPLYALPPQIDEIWLYPALDASHRFDLEWVGVAQEYEDTDEVTFDSKAAACAAHFIRSHLLREILQDSRRSAESFALFQRELRGLVVDNEQRDQGAPVSVAPYDYRRRWRCCGVCGIVTENSNNGTDVNPNAWAQVNSTGGDETLTPTAANMTFDVAVTGGAGLRRFVLATHGMTAGWRATVRFIFPLTAGIEVDMRNGALAGDQLLPAERYPDQLYTTDGYVSTATLEFVFGNNAWEYVGGTSPA